jgi:hypothetical protein
VLGACVRNFNDEMARIVNHPRQDRDASRLFLNVTTIAIVRGVVLCKGAALCWHCYHTTAQKEQMY